MAVNDVEGVGTPQHPWILTTPPGKSELEPYRDLDASPPASVVQVGSTQLRYHLPPVLQALGLAEVEHNARNNRMRAL